MNKHRKICICRATAFRFGGGLSLAACLLTGSVTSAAFAQARTRPAATMTPATAQRALEVVRTETRRLQAELAMIRQQLAAERQRADDLAKQLDEANKKLRHVSPTEEGGRSIASRPAPSTIPTGKADSEAPVLSPAEILVIKDRYYVALPLLSFDKLGNLALPPGGITLGVADFDISGPDAFRLPIKRDTDRWPVSCGPLLFGIQDNRLLIECKTSGETPGRANTRLANVTFNENEIRWEWQISEKDRKNDAIRQSVSLLNSLLLCSAVDAPRKSDLSSYDSDYSSDIDARKIQFVAPERLHIKAGDNVDLGGRGSSQASWWGLICKHSDQLGLTLANDRAFKLVYRRSSTDEGGILGQHVLFIGYHEALLWVDLKQSDQGLQVTTSTTYTELKLPYNAARVKKYESQSTRLRTQIERQSQTVEGLSRGNREETSDKWKKESDRLKELRQEHEMTNALFYAAKLSNADYRSRLARALEEKLPCHVYIVAQYSGAVLADIDVVVSAKQGQTR